jgi:CBS domain-containing protein
VDDEVSQAARTMLEFDVKRVVVLDGFRVVGVVSCRDLVKVIARPDEDLEDETARASASS